MESNNLGSQLKSKHNSIQETALTPPSSEDSRPVKGCAARLTTECQLADGKLDPDRARRGNTKYCPSCAYRLKLDRNAANKRRRRREIGWRAYDHAYRSCPTYVDPESHRKAEHANYMRAYRAYLKHRRKLNLSLTEREERAFRRDFIKALVDARREELRPRAARAEIDHCASVPVVGKARAIAVVESRCVSNSSQMLSRERCNETQKSQHRWYCPKPG